MSAAPKRALAPQLTITPQQPRIGAEVVGISLREPFSKELRDRPKSF
jgi:hypothetical protein